MRRSPARRASHVWTSVGLVGIGLALLLVPIVFRPRLATPVIRPDLDSDTHVLIFRGHKPDRDTADDRVSAGARDPQGARLDPLFRRREAPKLDARDPWTNEEPEPIVRTSSVARTVLDHRDPWSPDTEYPSEIPTSTPLDPIDPWSGALSSRGEVSSHTLAD